MQVGSVILNGLNSSPKTWIINRNDHMSTPRINPDVGGRWREFVDPLM
jgi:hypothetical protein